MVDEVVEDVGHAQWVSTVPKVLRIDFLHLRELLGALARLAAETVKELLTDHPGTEGGPARPTQAVAAAREITYDLDSRPEP